MEILIAFAIIALAAGGLALGLLAGKPVQSSCGGLACEGRCAICPRRRKEDDNG